MNEQTPPQSQESPSTPSVDTGVPNSNPELETLEGSFGLIKKTGKTTRTRYLIVAVLLLVALVFLLNIWPVRVMNVYNKDDVHFVVSPLTEEDLELCRDDISINNSQFSKPDTDGWKIYRNDKCGFEFKYPADLVFGKESYMSDSQQPAVLLTVKTTPDPVVDGTQKDVYSIHINVTSSEKYQTFYRDLSFSEFNLDGIIGQLSVPYGVGEEGGRGQMLLVSHDNRFYRINFVSGVLSPTGTFESHQPVFSKILSTFRFIK